MSRVGIVVIGRNEGERLRACLESLRGERVIYVDSGSTDGSVELARSMGAEVVALDMSRPFSAARARNEGFARLQEVAPAVEYVQFVDGDCAVAEGWLDAAWTFLEEHQDYAVVCGRRRERFPEASSYNRLCDMEWETPVGDAKACGGDALVRVDAVVGVGGYDPSVMAAEDDEFCLRLRRGGWKIHRLDHDMTLHDAAMTRFGQWWKRAERSGYAYAQGACMHGRSADRHFVRQVRSTVFWGAAVPLAALGLALLTHGVSLMLLAGYGWLGWRVYRYGKGRGWSLADARLYAVFVVLAKFPQVLGLMRFHWRRVTGRQQRIIEYKTPMRVCDAVGKSIH